MRRRDWQICCLTGMSVRAEYVRSHEYHASLHSVRRLTAHVLAASFSLLPNDKSQSAFDSEQIDAETKEE